MKNKFNNLTSKEWLPFQKSWFKLTTDDVLYRENIRFFTKADELDERILYFGKSFDLFKKVAEDAHLQASQLENYEGNSQFILMDLRGFLHIDTTLPEYYLLRAKVLALLRKQFANHKERRFVNVLVPNIQNKEKYFAFAWDLAKHISKVFSLKDEKIACCTESDVANSADIFAPTQKVFYCLYFRKDEQSANGQNLSEYNFFARNSQINNMLESKTNIPTWFILKPQPRKKNEVLHPAKFPEVLVEMFVSLFTQEHQNIFDPMSGTGSTQIGALKLKRNGYGTELSEFFSGIANERCKLLLEISSALPEQEAGSQNFKIINKDARQVSSCDFPPIDYMITSPPYWDMLNMKGAENQAKRLEKGLKTNYSDDPDDLGNIQQYDAFLLSLRDIYFRIASLMKGGSYLTIVVKNIKKKGSNYPFAWDLAHLLQEKLILLPEVFWCQDDISIAPYGYGNTWVSNTFHQYCLNFQVPTDFCK